MPQAIVDPDELMSFASDLSASAHVIRDRCSGVTAEFERLHALWRDDKYRAFQERLEESIGRLRHFCREAEEYADFLRHKARLAEDYLRP